MANHADLIKQAENPISHAFDICLSLIGWGKPEGMCQSDLDSMSPFVLALSHGVGDFYDDWMKNLTPPLYNMGMFWSPF